MAERFGRTAKQLSSYVATNDLNPALLLYRATLLPFCSRSPSELLMGRCIRTKVPQTNEHYVPEWPYLQDFERCDKELKKRKKKYFDRHNQVHSLPDITQMYGLRWQTDLPKDRWYLLVKPQGRTLL